MGLGRADIMIFTAAFGLELIMVLPTLRVSILNGSQRLACSVAVVLLLYGIGPIRISL